MKKAVSFRLSDEGLALIVALAAKLGVSQTAVLELAVRLLAAREIDKKKK